MSHTPTTPADERAMKLIERTPVGEDHLGRLRALVAKSQALADGDGEELQAEFGKEAVSMIVNCNQFVRVFRSGENPGVVELFIEEATKALLREAGFTIHDAEGAIFKMFGWARVDPMEGDLDALEAAVATAYARVKKPKSGLL